MANPNLPFELYQLIIQYTCDIAHSSRGQHPSLLREEVMAIGLKETLASCLLVNRAFYRIARVLLFKSIYVTTEDNNAFIDELKRILVHQHPDLSLVPLGSLVDRLTLDVAPPSVHSRAGLTDVHTPTKRMAPFLAIARLFRSIQTLSFNLSSLSIISTTGTKDFYFCPASPNTDWNLARIIIDMCQSPTLRSLTVEECFSFPAHCLWNPSIRHLFLDRITIDVSGDVMDSFRVPKREWADTAEVAWRRFGTLFDSTQLQTLKIRDILVRHSDGFSVRDAVEYVKLGVGFPGPRGIWRVDVDGNDHERQAVRFPNLTTLVWPLEQWGQPDAGSDYGFLLATHAPNLVTLQLEYDLDWLLGIDRPGPRTLTPFTKLENLVVSIPKRSYQSIIGPLEQTISLLQTTEGLPSLKTVSIDIHFITPAADVWVKKHASNSETLVEVDGWEKLARCMEAYPARVAVGVSLKSPSPPNVVEEYLVEGTAQAARWYHDFVDKLLAKHRLNTTVPSRPS